MIPLDLVKLTALMDHTSGRREIIVGLIDGPVAINHPDLTTGNIREIPGRLASPCAQRPSAACLHGTFVAGILFAKKGSAAPAICPDCTLLLRPIFLEPTLGNREMPSTTPEELAAAIVECVEAGAHILNMSVALAYPSTKSVPRLEEALDYAATRGVILVAAAGNQGTLGSSVITRHPWVLPVSASDLRGRPMDQSNLGNSIGKRGLSAPGEDITSLGADGQPRTFGGTSAATPFVTGTIALLWSEFPAADAAEMRFAVTQAHAPRRNTVVPPLLDARAAYLALLTTRARR
jgi:subtilisin family serine protease